jgi:hypothetical protein
VRAVSRHWIVSGHPGIGLSVRAQSTWGSRWVMVACGVLSGLYGLLVSAQGMLEVLSGLSSA